MITLQSHPIIAMYLKNAIDPYITVGHNDHKLKIVHKFSNKNSKTVT